MAQIGITSLLIQFGSINSSIQVHIKWTDSVAIPCARAHALDEKSNET